MLLYVYKGEIGTGTDGGRGSGRGRKGVNGRPKSPWTTARTTTMLRQWGPRQCAATSVLRSCCFNWCAEQTQGQYPLLRCWGITETKEVQLSEPSSTSLLLISSGLSWGSSTTSLLLISPGPANKTLTFFVRVQLTSLLLISLGMFFLVYCSNTLKLTFKGHQIFSVSWSLQIRHTSSCRHYLTEFCYRSECLITRVWCSSVLFFFLVFFWHFQPRLRCGIGVGRKGYGGIFSKEGQSKGDNPFTKEIL